MKKTILFLTLVWCAFAFESGAAAPSLSSVDGLVGRIMPEHREQIKFVMKGSTKQVYYKVYASGGKVCIEGNAPTSLASGLRHYLKEYLNTSVSWTNFDPILPEKLPLPKKTIEGRSPYNFVTYMNYCTFGYSSVYWDWERWEKEIDWMALNGVTNPLTMVGVEQVWLNFLKRIGYSDADARHFLTGPVYMPWLLMGNMETLGGPMPDEWFKRQVDLQHKILARMESYGMKPIFQGFYGMVPSDFQKRFPQAKVVEQGTWNTFQRPAVLSPLDPEFEGFAQIWYDEYESLFGKADYYAGDLFHEGGKTGGLDVSACAREVQKSMLKNNPASVWVVQSWGANPTEELMAGLDRKHSLVVELCAEYWNRWKDTRGYRGISWAWGNISNWGGNIGLHGRLDAIASQPIAARNDEASRSLHGIAFVPEGIETNPVVPELWADMVWKTQAPDMTAWIDRYAQYRYHSTLPSLREAWQGFYRTAYGTYEGSRRPSEPVFCANPSLTVRTVSAWSQSKIFYRAEEFAKACAVFLQDADQLRSDPNYRYDAVDMVRQYISNLGRAAYADIQAAWKNKDRAAFDQACARFLQLIQDQDELLLSHPGFCLKPWLQQARDAAADPGNAALYEYYNRLILTSWDVEEGSLNDYAHRELGGLLGTYYYKRWDEYLNYLGQAWYRPNLPKPYIFGITRTWLYENIDSRIEPGGQDPVETAVRIFQKYYKIR